MLELEGVYTELPEWNEPGSRPPQGKRNEGWKPEEKPPAPWHNWLFHRIYQSFLEIAQAAVWRRGGPTAQRPTNPRLYEQYFDTDLGRPIWWDGNKWVDASGQAV